MTIHDDSLRIPEPREGAAASAPLERIIAIINDHAGYESHNNPGLVDAASRILHEYRQLRATLVARDAALQDALKERDLAQAMLVGEEALGHERMLAIADCEHDYVQKLKAAEAALRACQEKS